MASSPAGAVRLVSTCPPSGGARTGAEYLDHVRRVSTWSEAAGHEAILVYTDNRLVDPWLVAAEVVRTTERLCPLVAVQPVYMHPYTVAKLVSTFAHLYGRKLWLNFVAGGFRNDLVALNDQTPHDQRYARVGEYVEILSRLLKGETLTFEGAFYRVENLRLTPPVEPQLLPQIMLSGSSEAGLETAKRLDAIAVQYPQPPAEYEAAPPAVDIASGIRVGVIARETAEAAWHIAFERFPPDRKGQIAHQLAMKTSDSSWHRQLSQAAPGAVATDDAMDATHAEDRDPYWLLPFENYKTFCPYLVGSHERVARELGRYVGAGFRTIILDVPASHEDLDHINRVVAAAAGQDA